MNLTYDIAIVGAGIAGSALACSLATAVKDKPLRIALIDFDMKAPNGAEGLGRKTLCFSYI